MKFGQQDSSKQRKRRKAKPRQSGSLAAHRAFAPMIGLWGVMLAGAAVMVLPPALVDQAVRGTTFAALGVPVQPIAAMMAALLLGGMLFIMALGMSRSARRRSGAPSVAERAVRSVRPIDPLRDLGSRSLDDPLESMPFATPAWRDAAAAEDEQAPQAPPQELDLAGFAEMPGRNGVWVEDIPATAPAAQPAPLPQGIAEPITAPAAAPVVTSPDVTSPVTTLRPSAPLPDPGTAALARLRAVAPSELSLVEMVERFAGALHEHRTSPPNRSLNAADLAAREAALAEALKALAALSGVKAGDPAQEPLRAALAQLQPRRGAA